MNQFKTHVIQKVIVIWNVESCICFKNVWIDAGNNVAKYTPEYNFIFLWDRTKKKMELLKNLRQT